MKPETEAEKRLSRRCQRVFLAIIRLAYEVLIQNVEVFHATENAEGDKPNQFATGFNNVFPSSDMIAEQLERVIEKDPYVLGSGQ